MRPFVAIDFETADPGRDSACAVGLVRVEGAEVVARAARLIRPPRDGFHPACQAVHGLRWADVAAAPRFAEVWPTFAELLAGVPTLVAHNVAFDRSVLAACCRAAGLPEPRCEWVCTLELSRARWPKPLSNRLPDVCARLGVPLAGHHEAGADAEACARVLIALEGRRPADRPAPAEPPPAPAPAPAPVAAERPERFTCPWCNGPKTWLTSLCLKCLGEA